MDKNRLTNADTGRRSTRRLSLLLLLLALIVSVLLTGCSDKDKMPKVPELSFADYGENEWELKILRLSDEEGFILEKFGTITRSEEIFGLRASYDAPSYIYSGIYALQDSARLDSLIWKRLKSTLSKYPDILVLGFLYYADNIYLAAEEAQGIAIYSLSEKAVFSGGITPDELCEKIWAYHRYVEENGPEGTPGGNGIDIGTVS